MTRRTKRGKIAAKVFAAILSVTMGLSSLSSAMPGSIAYAENGIDTEEIVTDAGTDSSEEASTEAASEETSVDTVEEKEAETVKEADAQDLTEDEVSEEETLDAVKEEKENPVLVTASERTFDDSKADVWDFGAEDLGEEYNNRLDEDTINNEFYKDLAAGTKPAAIASFSIDDGDFAFVGGGKSNHRLRTTNTALSRHDEKSLVADDGTNLTGYIYSNAGSTAAVYLSVAAKADDTLTYYVSSNGGVSNLVIENESDATDKTEEVFDLGGGKAKKIVFYPGSTAKYKIYSTNEKLVVARVIREHAKYSTVSGSLTGYKGNSNVKLVFTNQQNGNVVKAAITDGAYSAKLAQGFDYKMSLEGAAEYVIKSDPMVKLSGDTIADVEVDAIKLATVTGQVEITSGVRPETFNEKLNLVFTPDREDSVYVPEFKMTSDGKFEVTVEAGVDYTLTAEGVDDYELLTTSFKAEEDTENAVIRFIQKVVVTLGLEIVGADLSLDKELADTKFTFVLLDPENDFEDTDYSYTFTGTDFINEEASLRVGQFRVEVEDVPEGYAFDEAHSYDAKMVEGDLEHIVKVPFISTKAAEKIPYAETVTVGNGKDYETINDALAAIRNMDRTADQRVTVEIEPGDYQEMLVIDTPNVTFKNAVAGGSITPVNKGVDIAADSVRITSYYGHGYTYFSMGADCKYDEKLLEVNKYNGYASFDNPGSGTTAGSYWNATVVVNAEGFEAQDIIFENSFNQYQSELASKDVLEKHNDGKEGSAARNGMAAGDVTVQDKKYVERAAAMAIRTAANETYFNHCAFIGRQDTLYGDAGSKEAYYNCDIYGGTDYIFGGMTAVFAKCNLIFNTSEDANDVGYITAAQQKDASARGYLMYNCKVTSTEPGQNTASEYTSKAGYLGRPWQAATSEVVFYETVVDATCDRYKSASASLINPAGWLSTLSGESARNVEYGTVEKSGVDNSASRVAWANTKSSEDEPVTADGKPITVATFLGDWDPFTANGNDMTIVLPEASEIKDPNEASDEGETKTYIFDATTLTASADKEAIADGTAFADSYYISKGSNVKRWNAEKGVTSVEVGKAETGYYEFNVSGTAEVTIEASSNGGSNSSKIALVRVDGDNKEVITNNEGIDTLTGTTKTALTYYNLTEGTYRLISPLEATMDRGFRLYTITTTEAVVLVETEYVFDATTLTAAADKEVVADGTTFADAYFAAKGGVTKRTNSDVSAVTSVEVGKAGSSYFEFNVTGSANVTAEVSSTGGSNESAVALVRVNGDTEEAVANEEKITTVKGTSRTTLTYYNLTEGTYRLESPADAERARGARVYKIVSVQTSAGIKERKAWGEVADPVIKGVALSADRSGIEVAFEMETGFNGADSVLAVMYNAETGNEVMSANKITSTVASFTPAKSGKYFFILTATRAGEIAKVSERSETIEFVLPLATPGIKAVTNKGKDAAGKGKLEVSWTKVNEAKKYDVEIVQVLKETVKEEGSEETTTKETEKVLASANGLTEREIVLSGLPIGEDVTVRVYAIRDAEKSKAATATIEVTGNNDRTWSFASYGSNASTGDSATVNADGSIYINTPSSTKIVPGSTDGIGYYYTKIDPSENFTFTAKLKVEKWPYDNGQEGFGLMVADAVGEHGDGAAFWNNSYQAAVTQMQYNWDPTITDSDGNYVGGPTNVTSDSTTVFQEKMRLGLGWIVKSGVTLDQKQKTESGQVDTPEGFTTVSGTFETSVASAVQSQLPGITKDSSAEDVQNAFKNFTIETLGKSGAASYGQLNIIDASKASKTVAETVRKIGSIDFTDISEVRYQIQRNNTGYVLRYLSLNPLGKESELNVVYATDESGNRISYAGTYNGKSVVAVDGSVYEVLSQKVVYDENRNNLTMIDKKNIYLGMFSARKSAVTVEEYKLETVDPDDDYAAEERVAEPVALNAAIMSSETSNTADYDLIFNANADGTLSVVKEGKILAQEMEVKAGKWATIGSSLNKGDNKFSLVFTPAPGYTPGEYQYLVINKDDPDAKSVNLEYTVKYEAISGDVIYVAPNAKGSGTTKDSPASIYDAVSFAAPGQKIYLAAGTYNLGQDNGGSNKGIRIERGTDGTSKKMITMETDPDDVKKGNRAVLSFAGSTFTGSAFVLSGNYWHLKNFDVTGSKNGEKGLHIAGNHNVVEMVNAYMNGNTGIEIAREGSVGRDMWPSYNLILNCTSYLNFDAGFEDADGFAAKITCGDGNRFVGCVSAYNADDGWDLFAKVQSGSIGAVTIENSIAYKNGYLLGSKSGQDYSVFTGEGAVEFEAGNGNGFKLGGDGMSGYHVLRNSYAFGNKANGIDSNSCPDIQVFNSVSYANGTNLVLNNYAKAINSDYAVSGLISIGNNKTKADSISMLGAQVASKIYNSSNFFWNGSESVNAADSAIKLNYKIFANTDPKNLGVDVANNAFVNRDSDGNIVYGGFLQLRKADEVEDAEVKAMLSFIENNGIGVNTEVISDAELPEFTVFANDVKTLKDVELKAINKDGSGEAVKLPEGYTWVNEDVLTAAYAGTSAEFGIVNKNTGDTSSAIVNFVQVKGVELHAVSGAQDGLFGDNEIVLEAVPVVYPDVDIDASLDRFKYSFADSKKLGLKEEVNANRISLTRQASSKQGVASYTATLQFTAGSTKTKVTSAAYTFATRAEAFKFEYKLSGNAEVDANGRLILEKGDFFRLEGLKVTGVGTNTKVNVTVGDSKVIKYSSQIFKAVGSGTTYITLTSAADKTVQLVLMVKVNGNEFAVNASTITVDKAKNDGTSFVVSSQGDAVLSEVSVSKVLKGTKERTDLKDKFEIRKVIGNVYKISVKADTDESGVETNYAPKIANGNYTLVLASKDKEFDPVVVAITETKPNVTLKQTKKINLFYKAGSTNNTGSVKATSKLASVTLKSASESDFNLVSNGSEYQLVMTNSAQKKIDSRGRLNTRMVLTASFDGYKKAYDKTVNFTVATQTLAPKYKLELENRTLYTQLGIRDSEFKILNRTTGEYVSDAQIKLATSRKSYVNANKYFTVDEETGVYTITTTRTGTAKISVVDPDFSKDPATRYATDREVILDAPLTINNSKPSVTIASARINGDAEYAASSRTTAKVTVRNATDYTIRDLQLAGNSAKARKLLPFLSYSFERDAENQPMIVISFKDSEDMTIAEALKVGIIKRGTYGFTANYSINMLTGRKSQFNLEIMTAATATGSVKGSVNLVNRAGSYATVTPHITRLEGKATGMYFKGAENLFDVVWDSTKGVARVYAKEDASYRVNSRYKVTPVFKVSTDKGEVEVTAKQPVSILVKQSKLTLSEVPVIEVKISDTDQLGMAVISATAPKGAEIAAMEQLTRKDQFNVSYDAKSGNAYVAIADVKGLKVNTTYSIKMNVVPVGSGVGASTQSKYIKVRVIR